METTSQTTIDVDFVQTKFMVLKTRRGAFTMIELIVVVALLGILAVLVVPKVSWMEPPKRVLQRSFIEAGEMARNGLSVRFSVDKKENRGEIIPEVLVKEEEEKNAGGKKA
ncbi:MAG: type II secretion system GspH family protein, partial [Synergistaceae bacterium]|nr:type II secretion system GspH family protein [Synergistaceae bacterium]